MKLVFETDRLLVRELVREDFPALHRICGDAEVMKYVGNLHPYKEPQTRQAILKCLRSYGRHGFGGWALLEKTSSEFIGYGGFEFVVERSIPEVFYLFSSSQWGKGLATEFAMAAVTYGFEKLNMVQIGASFDPANKASMRVASKAGLRYSHEGLDEFKLPTIYFAGKR